MSAPTTGAAETTTAASVGRSALPTPLVIFTHPRRSRVLLRVDDIEQTLDMLAAAGIPATGEANGVSIGTARLTAALRAARAAGWTVTPSRAARRAQAPRGGRR